MLATGRLGAPKALVYSFAALVTVVLAFSWGTREARADLVTVTGGQADLTVDMSFIQAIGQDNIFNVILPPATVDFTIPPVAHFPITAGGTLEDTTLLGQVNLGGALRIVKYNADFTAITHQTDSTNLRIVNGNMFVGDSEELIPTPSADFVNVQFTQNDEGTITYDADMQMNAGAALVLNVLFDTDVFQPNMPMGHMHAVIHTDANPGYPRPQAAVQMRTPLAVAYEECTTPDRLHTGLTGPSCSAAATESDSLTVGTSDANGHLAQFNGFVKLTVCANGTTGAGTCSTPAGMTAPDVRVQTSLSDIRCKADGQQACEGGALSDYTGELQVRLPLRITDKSNGPSGGPYSASGTTSDFAFDYAVPCQANPAGATSDDVGGSCQLLTSVNALTAGAVQAGKRANWETGPVTVLDGGPDGDADTADNTVFARQGSFIP